MEAQDFRSLQEAYLEVIMNEGLGGRQSTPDEIIKRPKPDLERREVETDAALRSVKAGTDRVSQQQKANQAQEFLKKHPRKKRTQKEQVDLYDIILSYLLDEGYAETPESAEVIMVNMSEDWRESIVEAYVPYEGKPQEKVRAKQEKLADKWDKKGSERRFHKMGKVDSTMTNPVTKGSREEMNRIKDISVKRRNPS